MCIRDSTKPTPMVTKSIGVGQNKEIFVKMAINEPWLMGVATGQKTYNRSCFSRSTLLTTLREQVERACDGNLPLEAANPDEEDPHDPMNDVSSGDEALSTPSKKRTRGNGESRTRYYRNHAHNSVVRIPMPRHPPELAGHKMYIDGIRTVRLFVVDRKMIWLHLSDVPWAVLYLYVQCLLKGVPLVAPDSAGPTEEAAEDA